MQSVLHLTPYRRKLLMATRKRARPAKPTGDHEFKISVRQLMATLVTLATLAGGIPVYWTITDHFMNRAEIEKEIKLRDEAIKATKGEIDKKMKDHADHDASVQKWNQFGFAANRLEYLDDKVAECDAKKMVSTKLAPDEAAICARYDSKQKSKTTEAADLKTQALKSTEEKP